jgi:hypothetical protein
MDTPEQTDDDLDDLDPMMALWRLETEARACSGTNRADLPDMP